MVLATEGPGQDVLAGDKALLADALLGAGLPEEAEQYLYEAGLAYHEDAVAEQYLRSAQALAPDHAAVLIGLYRFYFYKGRLAEALDIARLCLTKAARENDLPPDWRDVAATDAMFGRYDDILPRFFLFTLKGYAYLQMRLGNLDEGRAAVMKLLELDPSDKIGAKVLLGVLERIGQGDDE
jgi:tetratricopeptide (TPR) repeat protein